MAFKVSVGKNIEKNTRAILNKILAKPEVIKPAAEITLNEIKLSITQAKEPATGKPFQAPKITDEWKDRKKKLSKKNKPFDALSGGGTSKARLIFTGQWIKSINYFITKPGVIEIFPTGDHAPYKNLNGTQSGESISNQTLGQYLKDQGRNWVGFPFKIKNRIVKAIQSQIRRELTKRKK